MAEKKDREFRVEVLVREDVDTIAEQMGLETKVPESLVDEILQRAAQTYRACLEESDMRYGVISESILAVLDEHGGDDGAPHTDYTCPKCGNRDSFHLDKLVVEFEDVPVAPGLLNWQESKASECEPRPCARLTCDECGYEDGIGRFQMSAR